MKKLDEDGWKPCWRMEGCWWCLDDDEDFEEEEEGDDDESSLCVLLALVVGALEVLSSVKSLSS